MPNPDRQVRARFWVQAAFATAAAVMFVVTLISREWIEEVVHVDPDGGNGDLEWLIVVVLAMVAVVLALTARREWRRARPAVATG